MGSLGGVMDVDQDTFIKAEFSAETDNDELWFYTDNTERMRILNNGNIGIENDSPQNLLEVSGSLQLEQIIQKLLVMLVQPMVFW